MTIKVIQVSFYIRKIREVYLGILLVFTPRFQLPALKDDDFTTVVSDSEPPPGSLLGSTESPGSSDARKKESSLSSHVSCTQHITESFWVFSDESNAGSGVDGIEEEKMKNDCNSEFDDSNSSVIVERTEADQNTIDGSSYVDEDDYGGDAENRKGVDDSENYEAIAVTGDGFGEGNREKGPYDNIKKMLNDLKLEDQLYRFEDNVIRDTVLEADKDTLKGILKEVSFPAGVIYEILLFLDKSRVQRQAIQGEETATERNTATQSFPSSEFRFSPVAPNAKQQEGYSSDMKPRPNGMKKRLLGIGRSANNSDDKYRQGTRQRAAPWKTNKSFGNQREGLDEDVGNWRNRRPAGRGQTLSVGKENKAISMSYPEGAGYEPQGKSGKQETRQIGKVEPIQQTSVDGRESEKETGSARGQGFGSAPRACLKCGNKGHMSHECTDITSIFI